MTKKINFRLWIAVKMSDLFFNKFCWADLVSWAYSNDPFWSFLKLYGHARGCQIDKDQGSCCYCGKFCHPDYGKEIQL